MAYKIKTSGMLRRRHRLQSDAPLSPADFHDIARRLGAVPLRAQRIGLVAARQAVTREEIETHWNGVESSDTAMPGDWIVTSMSAAGDVLRDGSGRENTYVVRAGRFTGLYERDAGNTPFGDVYKPITSVEALRLNGGFEIMAPWHRIQRSADGYLLLNGDEVYGNNRETFEATYRVAA